MIEATVTLRGGLFGKNIPRSVETAIQSEAIAKIRERLTRKGAGGSGGRGLGVKRNVVRVDERRLELAVSTTRKAPRVTGVAFKSKNVGIVKGMARRVVRKSAERIAREMGAGA